VEKAYKRGQMGLAYEIVINSNPCIAYLMEENTLPMQALVIAHACYGHNSFFKGNYLFRTWTNADAIIDYLEFARNFIARVRGAPRRGGGGAAAGFLPCADEPGRRPLQAPIAIVIGRRNGHASRSVKTTCSDRSTTSGAPFPRLGERGDDEREQDRFPEEPQENLLYFIEKNAPLLEPWQREIVRIVRKVAQYFYPQRQTQVMNEGWATFWHYTLLNRLYDEGYVSDGFMIEFLQSHTNVVYPAGFDSPHYSGINPYALGFAIFTDLRRMCESPTDEDRYWFPDIAGSRLAAGTGFRNAQLQGRELHCPVPEPEA
jgi:stage V sporulation protein R